MGKGELWRYPGQVSGPFRTSEMEPGGTQGPSLPPSLLESPVEPGRWLPGSEFMGRGGPLPQVFPAGQLGQGDMHVFTFPVAL